MNACGARSPTCATHFREAIDIAAKARATGVKRRTLERLSRDELGRTPAQVLAEIRVRHARELLEYSRLRIGQIAEGCGYTSSEQLAKAFRSHFKQTPRAWRQLRAMRKPA